MMKKRATAVAILAVCTVIAGPTLVEASETQVPVIDVRGATVIAFFPPVTDQELEKDADTNEVLSDFQLYASNAREPLKKAGVAFHELYAHAFSVRIGNRMSTFRPGKVDVGYYFIAPGKKPRIEYGVMTDTDLLQTANKYFRKSAK